MAEQNSAAVPQDAREREVRGGRVPGGRDRDREPGGFRIRLSDNELRAARAVQEAFQLRSTVAALGFSIRTIAQLLEQGSLDELVAQQRALGGSRPDGPPRGEGRRRPAEGRAEGRGDRRVSRPDPFARPSRPAPAPGEPDAAAMGEQHPGPGEDNPAEERPGEEVSTTEDFSTTAEAGEASDGAEPATLDS